MHKRIALVAIERLRQFEEVSKLVLYGSVSRGEERAGSDIDLALICDDLWKWSPSGIDSYPLGLFEKVNAIRVDMDNEYGISLHVPIYWNSEFERGIELSSGRGSSDLLHVVGKIVYDANLSFY